MILNLQSFSIVRINHYLGLFLSSSVISLWPILINTPSWVGVYDVIVVGIEISAKQ